MTPAPLRIGIAGVAHVHAAGYIHESHRAANATLVGLWDADATRAYAVATHHATQAFASLDDLLGSIDTLMIAGDNAMHYPVTLEAARRGIPTLCEKPLATNAADARAMVDAFTQANIQLGTAFPVRYSPAVRRLRDTIQSGSLGDTLMIRATNRGTFPGGWFGDKALAGGGAVMDHTVHVADLLRWIWQRECVEVYAEAATRHYDIPVDDCGMLLMTMQGGMFVSLDPSWSRPNNSYPTWGDVTMEITAMNGIINLDVFGQHVTHYDNSAGRGRWVGYGINLDALMIADWLDAVRHDKPAPISGVDGLRTVQIVEAAYRSAQSHQPEPVVHN